MNKLLLLTALFSINLLINAQTTVSFSAEKDNTLYESSTGALSNSVGEFLFAGRTNQGSDYIRRGLVKFNLSSLPANITITSASLQMEASKGVTSATNISLHRLNSDWGEGNSNAPGNEGSGTSSTTNDATWIHTFYNTSNWTSSGGDFNSTPTATAAVTIGTVNWVSSTALVNDVQNWVNSPSSNFGWIIIGDESTPSSAVRFNTREHATASTHPTLNITYTINSSATPNLVITEIMYNGPESGTDTSEFIEFFNAGNTSVDLNGFNFTQGVIHTFPSAIIAPNQYFTVAYDSSAFRNTYGLNADFIWTSGGLSNGGEDIILVDNLGKTIDSVDYKNSNPWPNGGNAGQVYGGGASLVLCNTSSDNSLGSNWAAATQVVTGKIVNGKQVYASPGVANTCPTPITLNIVSTNASCNGVCDGKAVANASGGSSPYTYLWSNGAMSDSTTNLCAGTYAITLTDANGTTSVNSTTISEPSAITIGSTSTNVTTNGGSNGTITITVGGGTSPYSYLWSDGSTSQNRTGLVVGTYCVTVSDANSCSAVDCSTISGPSALVPSITFNNITCNGFSDGNIKVSVTGGTSPYTYTWSNGAITDSIFNLVAGTYTVTVEDAIGTDSVLSTSLTEPPVLSTTLLANSTTCTSCNDGSIVATTSGGTPTYTYMWSNGATTASISNLAAGAYCVTINDANNCQNVVCDTVKAPGALANLIITEIMYNPPESGVDSLEYIEIVNAGNNPVPMNGYVFADGVTYTFGQETIQVGEFYVIAVDTSAFKNVFGFSANSQWTSGGLSNGGEDIVLHDNFGRTIDSVDYKTSSPWPSGTSAGKPSGGGASIELIDSLSDNNLGSNWRASVTTLTSAIVNGFAILGSPGFANMSVGINAVKIDKQTLSIYPNPSNGLITIANPNKDSKFVFINDFTGKLIFKTNINEGLNKIDLSPLESGIYFLNSGFGVQKIILTK